MPSLYFGYEALIRRYQLQVPPLRCVYAATLRTVESRTVLAHGGERFELPVRHLRDTESLVGQLTFAFKREHLNLTVLGALFEIPEVLEGVQRWLNEKPSSKYARMAGHLTTWMTGHEFDYILPLGCPRVPLLNPDKYIVGPAISDPKFGILNNVLGDKWFSPLIRKTPNLVKWLGAGLAGQVSEALQGMEPETRAQAVDYLYFSETRASCRMDDTAPRNFQAAQFGRLLEQAGRPEGLTEAQLGDWLSSLMTRRGAEHPYRQGQNWLSRSGRLGGIADFIPAPPAQVRPMMASIAGLAQSAAMGRLDPVLGAACVAFGFVFVRPFWDGNGRLHRFLLHHVLRESGFTPAGMVLPLSARILEQHPLYLTLLKQYSRPRTALLDYTIAEDGTSIQVLSAQAWWLYAYYDFTDICEFVYECCEACIAEDLPAELTFLRAQGAAVRELETWLDMRQPDLNALIKRIVQGNARLSEHKDQLAEVLSDDEISRIEATVTKHFAEYLDAPNPTLA